MQRMSRITNGQRAAICGLILAGVGFKKSCRIVGASYPRMRTLIGPDWTKSRLPIRLRAMTKEQRRLYNKLIPVLGRNATLEQVFR